MTKSDEKRVVEAIRRAEKLTSGEVRVAVSRHGAEDPVAEARKHFERIGMTRTPERNGVLIFVAPRSKTFAVIGDRGIDAKCGTAFWGEVAAGMASHFKRNNFADALEFGIGRVGEVLASHFPKRPDDLNSLPDKIERL